MLTRLLAFIDRKLPWDVSPLEYRAGPLLSHLRLRVWLLLKATAVSSVPTAHEAQCRAYIVTLTIPMWDEHTHSCLHSINGWKLRLRERQN